MAGEEVTHPCGISNKPDILSDSVKKKQKYHTSGFKELKTRIEIQKGRQGLSYYSVWTSKFPFFSTNNVQDSGVRCATWT